MDKKRLIREIIELQRQADRSRRQYELDAWMSLPLTIAQLKTLLFISNQGGSNSAQLAAALRVTPTCTTGIIDRLLRQGLVSRTENPDNRRMLLLRTTDKAEELLAKLRERRTGYMADILERMSNDELAHLAQGLNSLVKAAAERDQEADGG